MYWQAQISIESSVDSREENGGVFLGFCLLYLSNLAFLVKVSVSPFQWNINQLSVGTRNIPTAPVHLAITTNLMKKSQPGRLFVLLRHHLEQEPGKNQEKTRAPKGRTETKDQKYKMFESGNSTQKKVIVVVMAKCSVGTVEDAAHRPRLCYHSHGE